jgi:NAD(P)-dependent dehydrogenase (short-subunit alcohol dehydrogenase family)
MKSPRSPRQNATKIFNLDGRVAVITGGAGLLGVQHAIAIHDFGGIPILGDIDAQAARAAAKQVGTRAVGVGLDVTDPGSIEALRDRLVGKFKRIHILINNAARNPKVESNRGGAALGRFEDFEVGSWNLDVAVGLTGAMLCSRVFGAHMAAAGGGVILNIASDLALIGPDQRLYEKQGLPPRQQPKKPVSYSVVKSGLLGLTRYLATYWADRGVRANALCPGGVENNPPAEFLHRIGKLIPMGRMARVDEYQGAVAFLCSDASSYMNGAVVSMDGGRTAW